MATKKTTAKQTTATSAKRATAPRGSSSSFSAEERAAMKELARERKAAARGADGMKEVLASLAAMPEPDRSIGRRVHEIIMASAPTLEPRTWYGMPAYAKDGKVLCFFQNASKFKYRYSTLGFQDVAKLDEDSMWPVAFALPELTAAGEKRIAALVKKAVR